MCDVVRHSLLTLGISERSLLEVAPRPFASLIVQLGHRFFSRHRCPNLCHRFRGGFEAASDDQLELVGEASRFRSSQVNNAILIAWGCSK